MSYVMYLDDERECPVDTWVVARSSVEAMDLIARRGLPMYMQLDHDLGDDDTTMVFLKWLSENYFDEGPPSYAVHSANPVGRENIIAFLEGWRRAVTT